MEIKIHRQCKFPNASFSKFGLPMERRIHNKPGRCISEVVGFLPSGGENAVHPFSVLVYVAEYLIQSVHRKWIDPDNFVDVSSRGLVGQCIDESG